MNPQPITIPVFMWTEGVERGREMTALNASVQGADRLGTDIKVIIAHASNTLVNQHSDNFRTRKLLEDDTKCELIVSIDTAMNPSTKMANYLLPDAMSTEQPDWIPNGRRETSSTPSTPRPPCRRCSTRSRRSRSSPSSRSAGASSTSGRRA